MTNVSMLAVCLLAGMLRRLGDAVAPLALVSVGLQLRCDQFHGTLMVGIGIALSFLTLPLRHLAMAAV